MGWSAGHGQGRDPTDDAITDDATTDDTTTDDA